VPGSTGTLCVVFVVRGSQRIQLTRSLYLQHNYPYIYMCVCMGKEGTTGRA
jgi:hypothetical protein